MMNFLEAISTNTIVLFLGYFCIFMAGWGISASLRDGFTPLGVFSIVLCLSGALLMAYHIILKGKQ